MTHGSILSGLALAAGGCLYVLTTAFATILEDGSSPHHTAMTVGDLILITAIIWLTGGVHSEYYILYYLPILGAGVRLDVRDGVAASLLAGLAYVFVALAGRSHPTVVTSPLCRVLAVCVSAIVLVVFFSLLKREANLCQNLSETLHSSLGRVAAVYGIAHAANTRAGLAPLLSILLDHAARITRAANGWILLLSPEGQLRPTASLSSPHVEADGTIEFPQAPALRANSQGACITLTPDEQTSAPNGDANRTFIYVPLKTPAEKLGVCVLASRIGRKFSRAHLEFLESICAEASLAIENARLRSELRLLAITDHLTGLPSRREIERRLLDELTVARRHSTSLTLLVIDVDNLKSINDKLGHGAGDELLRSLGHLLNTTIRAGDAAGRMGGDEFLVVLPNTDADQAKPLADRLISTFPQRLMEHPLLPDSLARPTSTPAGLSIGIAATFAGRDTAKHLTARADAALYAAKRGGKNQSVIEEGETAASTAEERDQKMLAL